MHTSNPLIPVQNYKAPEVDMATRSRKDVSHKVLINFEQN